MSSRERERERENEIEIESKKVSLAMADELAAIWSQMLHYHHVNSCANRTGAIG